MNTALDHKSQEGARWSWEVVRCPGKVSDGLRNVSDGFWNIAYGIGKVPYGLKKASDGLRNTKLVNIYI